MKMNIIKKHKSLPLLISMLLAGCSTKTEHEPEVIMARKVQPYHVVKTDETVADVAAQYNMDEDVLIKVNKLVAPYTLIKNQRLIVYKDMGGHPSNKPNEPRESDGIKIKSVVDESPKTDEAITPSKDLQDNDKIGDKSADIKSDDKLNTQETKTDVPENKSAVHEEKEPVKEDDTKTEMQNSPELSWPVRGDIVTKFGSAKGGKESGIDIAAPVGTPVFAAANGVVNGVETVRGLGKTVVIRHPDGKMTVYGHLQSTTVSPKQKVTPKTKIGTVGKTGTTKKPVLHFQVRSAGKKAVDPVTLLP